ncbi:MAG: hypothetical protein E7518_07910 [Ruminococcaceae bacterium]|nr:hypothetical protein [Oscillospiraceae bacterium]
MILLIFALVGGVAAVVENLRRGTKPMLEGLACIRALWLPIVGFLLHGLISWAPAFALRFAGPLMSAYYFCILLFLFLNRREKIPMLFMALGSLCNFSVIAANGFRMPISPLALTMYPGMTPEAVYAEKVNYFVAVNGANLYPLGDIIPVPLGRLGGFASVGDLLLGVGLMLFLWKVLAPPRREQPNSAEAGQ